MSTNLKEYCIGSVFAIDDFFDHYVNENTILDFNVLDKISQNTFADLKDIEEELDSQDLDEEYQLNLTGGIAIAELTNGSDIEKRINKAIDNMLPELYMILREEFGDDFIERGVKDTDSEAKLKSELKDIISSSERSNKYVLVILDRVLEENINQTGKLFKVLDIVAELLIEKKNILLVMYSSKPERLNSYDSVIEYLKSGFLNAEIGQVEEKAEILALHLNFIEKSKDEEEIKSSLIRYVLKSQKSAFLNIYKESFDIADNSLRKKLWNSDKDQNRALFYYDYLSEGQHVDDIIFDLFTNKFRSVVSKKINQNHTMLINPLRKSMQRFTESYSDDNRILFLQFQKSLLLKLSNQVFKPISSSDITFGDIIKVSVNQSNKYYMVVGQECDLTVRHDSNRKLDYVQLVEMELHEVDVNSKMLITEIKKFIGSNANRNKKSIYQMFMDFDTNFDDPKSDVSLFFKALGFKDNTIEKMLKDIKSKGTQENYDLTLESARIQNERNILHGKLCYFSIKEKKERLSIDSIWLDALTLCEENGSIVLSDRTIGNSHEIRRPLRKHIQKKYQDLQADLIEWVSGSQYNELTNEQKKTMIDKALEFLLGKSKIKVTSKLEDGILELKIENAERIGRIEYLEARSHHHSLIEYQTRIGGSSTPGI